jgi:hypothetical protein
MSTIQPNDIMKKQTLDAILAELLLKFRPAHLMALYLLFVYFAIDGESDPVLRFIEHSTNSAGVFIPGFFWKHTILAACILIAIFRPTPLVTFAMSAPLVVYGFYAFRYGVTTGISPSVLTLMVCGFVAALAFTVAVHALIASEADRSRLLKENAIMAKQIVDSQITPASLPKPTQAQLEQAK